MQSERRVFRSEQSTSKKLKAKMKTMRMMKKLFEKEFFSGQRESDEIDSAQHFKTNHFR